MVAKDGIVFYSPGIAGTPSSVLVHWAQRAQSLTRAAQAVGCNLRMELV
jgi:hypothetical protein